MARGLELAEEFLALAERLSSGTIERVLAKCEPELGLQGLLGGLPTER